MVRRIVCTVRPNSNPHYSAIIKYGWVEEESPTVPASVINKQEMVAWVKRNGPFSAFVLDSKGDKAYCKVIDAPVPYLKTRPDGIYEDNLDALRSCNI